MTSDADRSLFVITGRNTFSAASLFAAGLESQTDAIFVGEPMGGSPNLYGDPEEISLGFSGLVVKVASRFFVGSTRHDPRLTIRPSITAAVTPSDYFKGIDTALQAILESDR